MLAHLFALSVLAIASPDDEHVYSFDDVQLTIDFSEHGRLRSRSVPGGDILRSRWTGRINKQRVQIELYVYDEERTTPAPEEGLIAAEDARDAFLREQQEASTSTRRSPWKFDEREYVAGPYGPLQYAVFGHKIDDSFGEEETYFVMAGGAAKRSYTIEVSAEPPLDKASLGELEDLLKASVRYVGEVEDREWTDEEATARWEQDAPEKLAKDLDILRTKHFLILTNSSGKKKFSKELEKSYDAIRKMYPFEERPEHKLLPIFLFRTPQQYYEFCVKSVGWSREEAEETKGVAWRDFYATWYEAPKDPVHIHELTHQLFDNRLFLPGGGSWFQEGVAEYMCTSKNERRELKLLVKKSRHVPLTEFLTRESLLGSSGEERLDGSDPSTEAYLQAACIIEFVHQSKDTKSKFQEFIHAVGRAESSSTESIDGALRNVFGYGLEEFEERFVNYWKKR